MLAVLHFDNFEPAWFWSLLVLAAIGMLVVTYVGIFHRSGRRLAWGLLALRLAGVAALLVAILKPVWSSQRRIEQRPLLAVMLDDSESMTLPAEGSQSGPTTRYARARQWLESSPLAGQLRERFDLRWFGIDGRPLEKPPAEPEVDHTDLVAGLEAVATKLRGQGLKAVVLVSDGRDTTSRPNYLTMEEYPQPVYALGFRRGATAEGAFDIAMVSATAPARVRVHNSVPVKLLVTKDGGPALQLPLTIERGGTALHTEKVELPAGAAQMPLTVNFTPTEPGDFILTARIDAAAGERSAAHNSQTFRLRVESEPIRVLLVEGTLRTEFTFLRDHLQQDPDVDLAALVRSGNPNNASATAAMLGGEMITAERLEKIDAVLLGDFEGSMLETESYKACATGSTRGADC